MYVCFDINVFSSIQNNMGYIQWGPPGCAAEIHFLNKISSFSSPSGSPKLCCRESLNPSEQFLQLYLVTCKKSLLHKQYVNVHICMWCLSTLRVKLLLLDSATFNMECLLRLQRVAISCFLSLVYMLQGGNSCTHAGGQTFFKALAQLCCCPMTVKNSQVPEWLR